MMRFIYVCMGVVALSAVSLMTQGMTEGLSAARVQVAERNNPAEQETVAAIAAEEGTQDVAQTAAMLNEIETAAGADAMQDGDFGPAFGAEAPKALAEDALPLQDAMQTETSPAEIYQPF